MNVEIGTEAVQFPEKEYIDGIFLAVWDYSFDVMVCVWTFPVESGEDSPQGPSEPCWQSASFSSPPLGLYIRPLKPVIRIFDLPYQKDCQPEVLTLFPQKLYNAKTQYRKFETNIPRKEIARPQS